VSKHFSLNVNVLYIKGERSKKAFEAIAYTQALDVVKNGRHLGNLLFAFIFEEFYSDCIYLSANYSLK
jgi:hypothetical protein